MKVQLEGEAPEGAAHDPFGAEALEEAVKAEGETGNKTRKKAGKEAKKAKRETAGDGRREAMAMTDTAPAGTEGGAA